MIYQNVTIEPIIARIIRNTRVQDTSYLDDLPEWIAEAMGLMKTKQVLSPKYQDINMYFHKGKLPCDLDHIKAVEYNGCRLKEGNSSKDITTSQDLSRKTDPIYISTLAPTTAPDGASFWTTKWEDACVLPHHHKHYYQIEMGYITTSFADGVIRVHYKAMPVDENGMPLIPDNENYKQAIYNYVRAMMIGAGYKDLIFSESVLMQRFEIYAERAISEITYPSVDSMEDRVNNSVRLIPQANYFDNFFRTDGPEQKYF